MHQPISSNAPVDPGIEPLVLASIVNPSFLNPQKDRTAVPDDFSLISECICPEVHPANLDVADALRRYDGPEAIRIAEYHLSNVLTVAADDHHELVLSHCLVAKTYEAVRSPTSALAHWESAWAALKDCELELAFCRADVRAHLGRCQVAIGRIAEGKENFGDASRSFRELLKDAYDVRREFCEHLLGFGEAMRQRGLAADAERVFRYGQYESSKLRDSGEAVAERALLSLGQCYLDVHKFEKAGSIFNLVVERAFERRSGFLHFYGYAGLAEIGFATGQPQDLERALENYETGLRAFNWFTYAPAESAKAGNLALLAGKVHLQAGRRAAAVLNLGRSLFYLGHADKDCSAGMIEALQLLLPCLHASRDFENESSAHDDLQRLATRYYGPDHETTAAIREDRLNFLVETRRWPQAIAAAEQMAEQTGTKHGAVSHQYVRELRRCAAISSLAGNVEDAMSHLRRAYRMVKKLEEGVSPILTGLNADGATIQSRCGQYEAARRFAKRAYVCALGSYGEDHELTAKSHLVFAQVLLKLEKPRAASRHARAAHDFFERHEPVNKELLARSFHLQGLALEKRGIMEKAHGSFERARNLYAQVEGCASESFSLACDSAAFGLKKADYLGVVEKRIAALRKLSAFVRETDNAGLSEHRDFIALLEFGARFATDLSTIYTADNWSSEYRRIAATYTRRAEHLKVKLKLPAV